MQTSQFVFNFRLLTGFIMAAIGLGAALSTTVGMFIHLNNKSRENYPIFWGAAFAILAPLGLLTIPYPSISQFWPAGVVANPFLIFVVMMLFENNENNEKKNKKKKK